MGRSSWVGGLAGCVALVVAALWRVGGASADCNRKCAASERDGEGCCKAASVVTRPHPGGPTPPAGCPEWAVKVAGGTFQMGSADGDGRADEHPRHAVTLASFCIAKTETTLAQYQKCTSAGACPAAPDLVNMPGLTSQQSTLWSRFCTANGVDRGAHPLNCVDWSTASTYCAWAGGRLPSEEEWEYAARGTEGRKFPWGDTPPGPKLLNGCGSECKALGGRLGFTWTTMFDADDGNADTAPVGSYPAGASPFGALDMAGNVMEWTSSKACTYGTTRCADQRVFRGGAWDSAAADGARTAARASRPEDHRSVNVGFRCARTL